MTFRLIDGGDHYFARLSPRSRWMDQHILVGGWEEQPRTKPEVRYARAIGDNIYWNLAGHPGVDRVDYNVIRQVGMHVDAPEVTAETGSETVEYQGQDEPDLWGGPDSGLYDWRKRACVSENCGHTVSAFVATGNPINITDPRNPTLPYPTGAGQLPVDTGYGLGVLFWERDSQAGKFMRYTDLPSADSYWMTDEDLDAPSQGGCALLPGDPTACGGGSGSGLTTAQRQLPANYAYDVTKLERLDRQEGLNKPIAVDVEVGCPFTRHNSGHCVNVAQFTASAWHALIAGARGIIWFQHSFSGPCIDYRTLIDGWSPKAGNNIYNCQITPGETLHDLDLGVRKFNLAVSHFERVLLSPTATNYVTSTTGDVSTLAKTDGRGFDVFAGAGKPATPPAPHQSVTFTLKTGYTGRVTVYGEHRAVQARHGVFTDTFADANTVHIYEIH